MNPRTRQRQHPTGRARARLWPLLWACALVALQCLAQAHRIDHAPGLAQVAGESTQGHQAGGNDCRLLDAMGLADALHSSLAFALATPQADAAFCAPRPAPQPRRSAGPYHARAPPLA